MTVLSAATKVSQKDGEAGDWEHCGEACTASLCDDAGQPRPVVDVVTWLKSPPRNENPDNGTPTEWIVQYLQAHGIACHVVYGDATIDEALDRRHNLIWLIHSDGLGNPTLPGSTTHWVRIWGRDAAGYRVMNPLGPWGDMGDNHTYPSIASCGQGIEIDTVLPADQLEDTFVTGKDVATILAALVYAVEVRPTAPPSVGEVQGLAQAILDNGAAAFWGATGSDEAKQSGGLVGRMSALLAQVQQEAATQAADEKKIDTLAQELQGPAPKQGGAQ